MTLRSQLFYFKSEFLHSLGKRPPLSEGPPTLLLLERRLSVGSHPELCLRQDSLRLHSTSPNDVTFQPHRTIHRSQNTPRNCSSFQRSSSFCFQNFAFLIALAKTLFTLIVTWTAAQPSPPAGGLLATPFIPFSCVSFSEH